MVSLLLLLRRCVFLLSLVLGKVLLGLLCSSSIMMESINNLLGFRTRLCLPSMSALSDSTCVSIEFFSFLISRFSLSIFLLFVFMFMFWSSASSECLRCLRNFSLSEYLFLPRLSLLSPSLIRWMLSSLCSLG